MLMGLASSGECGGCSTGLPAFTGKYAIDESPPVKRSSKTIENRSVGMLFR